MRFLKGLLSVLIALAILAVGMLLELGLLVFLIENVIIQGDFLFYEHSEIAYFLIVVVAIIPPVVLINFVLLKLKLLTRRKLEQNNELVYLWNRLGKFKILLILAYIILLYCAITSVNVVYEDKIVLKTFYNPVGKTYSYLDVTEIETGFGTSNFSCSQKNEKGTFYYTIKFGNKKVDFTSTTPNSAIERYQTESYLELEEFDKKLVDIGVKKTSSEECSKFCDFDKSIVERFLQIIRNK
ncbi:MAG: hypothetical protein J6R29_02270 [Clostridia bacterium]|nr:hypothetical protein [Clostridia bacterium]